MKTYSQQIDEAYENFIIRTGKRPDFLIMSNFAYNELRSEFDGMHLLTVVNRTTRYRDMRIARSPDVDPFGLAYVGWED